jgi:hypothetical protein
MPNKLPAVQAAASTEQQLVLITAALLKSTWPCVGAGLLAAPIVIALAMAAPTPLLQWLAVIAALLVFPLCYWATRAVMDAEIFSAWRQLPEPPLQAFDAGLLQLALRKTLSPRNLTQRAQACVRIYRCLLVCVLCQWCCVVLALLLWCCG